MTDKLNIREEAFCRAFSVTGMPVPAAALAAYAGPRAALATTAARLLRRPRCRKRILKLTAPSLVAAGMVA